MRVFISYSHDSAQHRAKVRDLGDRLRGDGVDCEIDQYVETPETGWPAWMAQQIDEADFVLMVASRGYEAGLARDVSSVGGTGVAWEEAFIGQAIYEAKGRNLKFIPVVFAQDDVRYIPGYLRMTTRYLLEDQGGYEELYRRITDQPKIARPPLGPLRVVGDSAEEEGGSDAGMEVRCPSVVWRLPRGFLLLEDLVVTDSKRGPVVAHYYQYDGTWQGGTHFDRSYRIWWLDSMERVSVQCRKLGIPVADCRMAVEALEFMLAIGTGRAVVHEDGSIEGEYPRWAFETREAEMLTTGPLHRQTAPERLALLGYLGPVRDLAVEGEELGNSGPGARLGPGPEGTEPEARMGSRRLRRETRLAMSQFFEADHPLQENVREVLQHLDPSNDIDQIRLWALELADALNEGIRFELDRRGNR